MAKKKRAVRRPKKRATRGATTRDEQLKILLSSEEKGWLDTCANASGLTVSDFVRQLIRLVYDQFHKMKSPDASSDATMTKVASRFAGAQRRAHAAQP